MSPAEVDRQHGAERGTGSDAEEAGVGERVAEERLQRGAHDGEAAADERRDQHARQAHRPQDDLAHLAEGRGRADAGARRQRANDAAGDSGTLPG